MAVHEAFDQDDDPTHKKPRLVTLHDNNINSYINDKSNNGEVSSGGVLSAEEKRKWIKNFIDRIPVEKENLFAWKVDWNLVDDVGAFKIDVFLLWIFYSL